MSIALAALLIVVTSISVITLVITLSRLRRHPRRREEPVVEATLHTLYEFNRLAFDTRLAIRDLRRSRRQS